MLKPSRRRMAFVLGIVSVGFLGGILSSPAAAYWQRVPIIRFPMIHPPHYHPISVSPIQTHTGAGGSVTGCGSSNVYLQPFFHYCTTPNPSHQGGALELPDPIFDPPSPRIGWTRVSAGPQGCEFTKDTTTVTPGHFGFEQPGSTGPFGYCPTSTSPPAGGPPGNNPPGGNKSPGGNHTRLIASQNTAVPLTPYYFNGCEPRPALTTVQNGPHFVLAPGDRKSVV